MKNKDVLVPGSTYHIYNRAVSSDLLFTNSFEYARFITMWQRYVSPVAWTYAYCLLPNHFHFLVKMKTENAICEVLNTSEYSPKRVTNMFRSLFGAYAKIFNNRHHRKGKLFMLPFKRKLVATDAYYAQVIYYIHRNPVHHGFVDHHTDWPYSSYPELTTDLPCWLYRSYVLEFFGGKKQFVKYHNKMLPINPDFQEVY